VAGKEKRALLLFTNYSDLKNMFLRTLKLDCVPREVAGRKQAIWFSDLELCCWFIYCDMYIAEVVCIYSIIIFCYRTIPAR
jgi:hypothetical protein